MKKQKLEEKSTELAESPEEMGPASPASKDQEKNEPSGKPINISNENSNANSPSQKRRGLKKSMNERLFEFFQKGSNTFLSFSPVEQKRYVERFCITISVGLACVLSSFFYWFLPPVVRVLVVPVFIGAAWWFGAKVVTKLLTEEGTEEVINSLKVVEFFHLFEAVKFSTCSFIIAAIPVLINPTQFQVALLSPTARTIFLGAFIWNLIGAPLYAQARGGKARQLIILVFGVPAATVTLWGFNAGNLMSVIIESLLGNS